MSFSDEDQIMTENVYIVKGYGANKLIKKFPNKVSGLQGPNTFLKKLQKLARRSSRGQLRTVRTDVNTDALFFYRVIFIHKLDIIRKQ